MIESLYIAKELFDHKLTVKDFEGVNGPNQYELDDVSKHNEAPVKAWHSVVTTSTADHYSMSQNNAIFSLPQFAELKAHIEKHILSWTGAGSIQLLRSWYLQQVAKGSIGRHHHHYPITERTVSGVFYVQGEYAPLKVSPDFDTIETIENIPGRLILFNGYVPHWVEPYQGGDKPRISISFDYRIHGQSMCDCEPTSWCFKCFPRKMDIKKHARENEYYKGHTFDYMIKRD